MWESSAAGEIMDIMYPLLNMVTTHSSDGLVKMRNKECEVTLKLSTLPPEP